MCPPLNKEWSCISICVCRYAGRILLKLQDRINQHISKSIRNNQKHTKILSKNGIAKKRSIHTSLSNVTQYLDHIVFKAKSAPTMTSNFLSLPGQEMHSIFQHWKPLTKNPQTNSMPQERIRLFFTNFPLRSVLSTTLTLPPTIDTSNVNFPAIY